jgi:hypothetical protein
MPELYTPFMGKNAATMAGATMDRRKGKAAQGAYMGDQQATTDLYGLDPQLAQGIQMGKQKMKQQELQSGRQQIEFDQGQEDRAARKTSGAQAQAGEARKAMESISQNAKSFDTYEEFKAYADREMQKYPEIFAQHGSPSEQDYEQAKTIGAEGGGSFEGKGMTQQVSNILIKGVDDPEVRASPEYARAYQLATKPEILRTPTGDMKLDPELPVIFRPPTDYRSDEDRVEDIETKVKRDTKIIPGTEKEIKTSEGEKKAAGFYNRMMAAEDNVSALGDFDSADSWEKFRGASNPTASAKMQQYRQAASDWIRAKLRKESGAVIAKEEMQEEFKTYFPEWGDKKPVLDQKKRARKEAMRAMEIGAGEAVKAGATGKKGPKLNEANLTVTFNGEVSKFPDKASYNAYKAAAGLE